LSIIGVVLFLRLGFYGSIAFYAWLVKRKLKAEEGDLRSGLFLTLAESTKHTWKPNILVPVVITRTLLGNFPI